MQRLVGVDYPVEGAIHKPLIYKNNVTVKLNNYCHLGAEAEIAIKIDKDIPSKINGFNNKEEIIAPEPLIAMLVIVVFAGFALWFGARGIANKQF